MRYFKRLKKNYNLHFILFENFNFIKIYDKGSAKNLTKNLHARIYVYIYIKFDAVEFDVARSRSTLNSVN